MPDEHRNVNLPDSNTPSTADDHVYTVEKLLKQRLHDGQHQFLVKWLGFPSSQNSWEPATNILNKRLIDNFYRDHPRTRRLQDPDYVPRVAPPLVDEDSPDGPVIAVPLTPPEKS